GGVHGRPEEPRRVVGPVHQGEPAVDHLVPGHGRRLFDCEIDAGPDPEAQEFVLVAGVPGVTEPEGVVGDVAHQGCLGDRRRRQTRWLRRTWNTATMMTSFVVTS